MLLIRVSGSLSERNAWQLVRAFAVIQMNTGSFCTGLPLSFCISNDTLTSKARLYSPGMSRHSLARLHRDAVLKKH